MGKKIHNENVGPRTKAATKVVILMNRLKHRPKSVPIQTDNEVVVQVRGDFDHLVSKLKKVFKSKGKDSSIGNFKEHDWKLKGLGFMYVYQREGNNFNSVRFVNVPGYGIKEEPEEEDPPTPVQQPVAAQPTPPAPTPPVEEDLDAILL